MDRHEEDLKSTLGARGTSESLYARLQEREGQTKRTEGNEKQSSETEATTCTVLQTNA